MTDTMMNSIKGMKEATSDVEKMQFAKMVLMAAGAYGVEVVSVDDEAVTIEFKVKDHDEPSFFFTTDEEHTEIKVKFADSEATPIYRDPALV